MKRKEFLYLTALGIPLVHSSLIGQITTASQDTAQLDREMVKEFVGKSHRDMDKVVEMYSENPALLNVAHDWGGGDYETALGAASHVGYIELVEFLIGKGAQANIFTACLFGQIEIVKKYYELFPSCIFAKGPHGFSLLHHAQRGGDNNTELIKWLNSKDLTETKFDLF